jgi:hypothetical protein
MGDFPEIVESADDGAARLALGDEAASDSGSKVVVAVDEDVFDAVSGFAHAAVYAMTPTIKTKVSRRAHHSLSSNVFQTHHDNQMRDFRIDHRGVS